MPINHQALATDTYLHTSKTRLTVILQSPHIPLDNHPPLEPPPLGLPNYYDKPFAAYLIPSTRPVLFLMPLLGQTEQLMAYKIWGLPVNWHEV